jgi:hypothetical protein
MAWLPESLGKDGNGIAQPAGGEGVRGWLSGIFKLLGEALTVKKLADSKAEGKFAAPGELKVAVVAGMTTMSAFAKGVYTGVTTTVQVSFDGGTTWGTLFGANIGTGAGTGAWMTTLAASPQMLEATIPPGATHLRLNVTAIATGEVELSLTQSAANYDPTVAAQIAGSLAAGSAIVGGIFSPGKWDDISSTPLAKEASVSSAAIDTCAVATASAFTNASTGIAELRGSATADVVGTLWLETGRTEATLKKVKKVTLVKEEGGEFYGEIIHKPSTRFARFTLVNGATIQTFLAFEMFRLANL